MRPRMCCSLIMWLESISVAFSKIQRETVVHHSFELLWSNSELVPSQSPIHHRHTVFILFLKISQSRVYVVILYRYAPVIKSIKIIFIYGNYSVCCERLKLLNKLDQRTGTLYRVREGFASGWSKACCLYAECAAAARAAARAWMEPRRKQGNARIAALTAHSRRYVARVQHLSRRSEFHRVWLSAPHGRKPLSRCRSIPPCSCTFQIHDDTQLIGLFAD